AAAALRVLIAVTGSDSHVVGLRCLEWFLEERGYDVRKLGVCTPSAEIAEAAAEMQPAAVLLGSQNGHGLKDAADLRDWLRAFGLGELPVYIGGGPSRRGGKGPPPPPAGGAAGRRHAPLSRARPRG